MSLYELTTDVTCHRPARWYGHLRYALCIPQQALALPDGSWLLALPDETDSEEYLYRLPDGRVVARERPLAASVAGASAAGLGDVSRSSMSAISP